MIRNSLGVDSERKQATWLSETSRLEMEGENIGWRFLAVGYRGPILAPASSYQSALFYATLTNKSGKC